jgi:GntR family transcriptional repressor for pyruvate dehydrogenase complex
MFEHARSNKISDHIVEQIRKAIFDGALKPGDRLPYEKELMKVFRVSKATLREALRSLEVLGFLEIRKGASGGAYVTEVNMERAGDAFANFLHFKNLSLVNLTEVRLLLEPLVAEKATLAIAEEDLKKLGTMIEEWDHILKNDLPVGSRKNLVEFHQIIAAATGNPILAFMLEFVERLIVDVNAVLQPSREFSQRVLKSHKRIYQALLERDPVKARREMVKHVKEVEKDLLSLQKEKKIGTLELKQLRENGCLSLFSETGNRDDSRSDEMLGR